MRNRKEIHDRVLNASNVNELASAYSEWADKYDTDLVDEMGYVAHTSCAELLQENLESKDASILDAGCGTGLVGEVLVQNGFQTIDGLDYSQDMLDQAEKKGIYKSLLQADLTQKLQIEDNTYDAVISVGTFTCGHVGPEALEELVRVTKPGGLICFTVREQAWNEDNYRQTMDKMQQSGAWSLNKEVTTDYIKQEGSSCKICLYQVNS